MHTATLAHETDWPEFRLAARGLLAQHIPPQTVRWVVGNRPDALDLFNSPTVEAVTAHDTAHVTAQDSGQDTVQNIAPATTRPATPAAAEPMPMPVPASFITLCRDVILHRDPGRFALLYRLLWRLAREPGLRHDTLDADMTHARLMSQAVHRDLHKMKAFVRFQERPGPCFVAWFEPGHYILEAVAPFFVRRFANMRWAILTPIGTLTWDGETLQQGPPVPRQDAVQDDHGEALWLTYYSHIFNPARLKLDAMRKEMPRKYWHNLPEARLIASLAAQATARGETMIEQGPTVPVKRLRPIASPVRRGERDQGGAVDHHFDQAHALTSLQHPILSLQTLSGQAVNCRRCPLWEGATQTVWGEGPSHAAVMIVGEQPGDQEDLQGRPFVGPSGQLFDRALAQLAWPRNQLYVTNAVKHFKYEMRGKRRLHKTPGQREVAACQHWLESEIAAIKPRAIIALGGTATHALLGAGIGVMAHRGQWLARPDGTPVLITLHPSALLRMPEHEKPGAFEEWLHDLRQASNKLSSDLERVST